MYVCMYVCMYACAMMEENSVVLGSWRQCFLLTLLCLFYNCSSAGLLLYSGPRAFGRDVFVLDTYTYDYIHNTFIMHPPSCLSTVVLVLFLSSVGERPQWKTRFDSHRRSRRQNHFR